MKRTITVRINGQPFTRDVEVRTLLSDFIRHDARLTGTHVGCEHGACGACTIQVDGVPMRSCLLLAVQAEGREIRTVEALAEERPDGTLHPLQQAFHEKHGLQCGFCTPGFLMSLEPLYDADEIPTSDEGVREAIAGSLCRCTGYEQIVEAVQLAASRRAAERD